VAGGEFAPDGVATGGRLAARVLFSGFSGDGGYGGHPEAGEGGAGDVPQARIEEVKRQIENRRKFMELTQEWVKLAIELCKLKQKSKEDK
jgi:hypothetical protein